MDKLAHTDGEAGIIWDDGDSPDSREDEESEDESADEDEQSEREVE